MLFRSPFWHEAISGSWFMVDAFGGACVYDESARYDAGRYAAPQCRRALHGGARASVVSRREPLERLPGLPTVGAYLFDSTLNGVYQSADVATSLLSAHMLAGTASDASSGAWSREVMELARLSCNPSQEPSYCPSFVGIEHALHIEP